MTQVISCRTEDGHFMFFCRWQKNGRGGEDSDNNSHNQLIKSSLQLQNIPQKSARFVSRFVTQFLIKKT